MSFESYITSYAVGLFPGFCHELHLLFLKLISGFTVLGLGCC